MKLFMLAVASFALVSCAQQAALKEYDARSLKKGTVINDEDGCFRVWDHPTDPDRVLVRQCEMSELRQAVSEGILSGLSFGILRTDHGAKSTNFIKAAEKKTGRRMRTINRIGDGVSGTGSYEVWLE